MTMIDCDQFSLIPEVIGKSPVTKDDSFSLCSSRISSIHTTLYRGMTVSDVLMTVTIVFVSGYQSLKKDLGRRLETLLAMS